MVTGLVQWGPATVIPGVDRVALLEKARQPLSAETGRGSANRAGPHLLHQEADLLEVAVNAGPVQARLTLLIALVPLHTESS